MTQTGRDVPHGDLLRIAQQITLLAQEASIELNIPDLRDLEASRPFLPQGKRIYISHLPKQTWHDTLAACRAVSAAGFDPIPHVPVRLFEDRSTFDQVLDEAVGRCGVREILLVAGDYPQAAGPYATVADALQTGLLANHGLQRVSFAGHPEGHPKVSAEEIRRAERDKAEWAAAAGLQASFLTQFFFEAQPFLDWVTASRSAGIRARLVAGLAGPAGIATLFRFALRCGVGPSVRALGARPTSFVRLIGEHGPENVIRDLAEARVSESSSFDALHLFCFGGYLRTCEWLYGIASGKFEFEDRAGFKVR